MNFRQRNNFSSNSKNKKKNIFLSVLSVLVLIFIFSFSGSRNFIFSTALPFWRIKDAFTSFVSNNSNLFRSKTDLISENNSLKQQIEKDKLDLMLKSLLNDENSDLKSVLNRKDLNTKSILSAVLIKPSFSPYDTLIIDAGSNENVSVGENVTALGNAFIGYISEVYPNSSKVVLYSSPGEKVNVLLGNSNIEEQALGIGGGNFSVEVPREIDIKEGDSIVIPSISTNIFGTVEKVEYKESDAFQKVIFKNPTNISELKWVLVVPLLTTKKN